MDPEQAYQEVLQEEQAKGVSPAVAEGRAKAARVRAEKGSPNPKEAKWWPGAQPHLEGDGAAAEGAEAAPEEAPAEVEEPAAEAPAEQPAGEAPAEQPAAEAPAEQPAAEAPAEQPAGEAPAEQPAGEAPAEQPAAEAPAEQPAAVATATEAPAQGARAPTGPAYQPTVGTTPGVPSGNRLRPEDAVSTEAQFDGQRAMQQRRKLIDELIQTGVPVVTAADTGRERSPWLSVMFLLIPLLVVGFLVANYEGTAPASDSGGETENGGGGGGGGPVSDGGTIVAEGTTFNSDTIELEADTEATITLDNRDSVLHDLAIYETPEDASSQSNPLFDGEDVSTGQHPQTIPPLDRGEFVFQCDLHPSTMNGTVTVE